MVMNTIDKIQITRKGVSMFTFETLCKVKFYNRLCNLDKLEMIKTVLNF